MRAVQKLAILKLYFVAMGHDIIWRIDIFPIFKIFYSDIVSGNIENTHFKCYLFQNLLVTISYQLFITYSRYRFRIEFSIWFVHQQYFVYCLLSWVCLQVVQYHIIMNLTYYHNSQYHKRMISSLFFFHMYRRYILLLIHCDIQDRMFNLFHNCKVNNKKTTVFIVHQYLESYVCP